MEANIQNTDTYQNPIEAQREAALRHYDEVSSLACHWSSFVEAAIKAYNPSPNTDSAELYLWDGIEGCLEKIDSLDDAKEYIKECYVEGNQIHNDVSSILILKVVANIDDQGNPYPTHTPPAQPSSVSEDLPLYSEFGDVVIGCADEDGEITIGVRRTKCQVSLEEARDIAKRIIEYVQVEEDANLSSPSTAASNQ
jgi:hypothetical protein